MTICSLYVFVLVKRGRGVRNAHVWTEQGTMCLMSADSRINIAYRGLLWMEYLIIGSYLAFHAYFMNHCKKTASSCRQICLYFGILNRLSILCYHLLENMWSKYFVVESMKFFPVKLFLFEIRLCCSYFQVILK